MQSAIVNSLFDIRLTIITTVFLLGRLFWTSSSGGRFANSCKQRPQSWGNDPASGLAGGSWLLLYGPRAARALSVLVWIYKVLPGHHGRGRGTSYNAPGYIRSSNVLPSWSVAPGHKAGKPADQPGHTRSQIDWLWLWWFPHRRGLHVLCWYVRPVKAVKWVSNSGDNEYLVKMLF